MLEYQLIRPNTTTPTFGSQLFVYKFLCSMRCTWPWSY